MEYIITFLYIFILLQINSGTSMIRIFHGFKISLGYCVIGGTVKNVSKKFYDNPRIIAWFVSGCREQDLDDIHRWSWSFLNQEHQKGRSASWSRFLWWANKNTSWKFHSIQSRFDQMTGTLRRLAFSPLPPRPNLKCDIPNLYFKWS